VAIIEIEEGMATEPYLDVYPDPVPVENAVGRYSTAD
jgi:hypothetical protein